MEFKINGGVWPTQIVLFNKNGSLDIGANKAFVERLIAMGCDGIFTVCQSSEMFFLTPEEKITLAKITKEVSGNKISLVASGHTANDVATQIEELKRMSDVGADALVLVSNRLGLGEHSFMQDTMQILEAIPQSQFGFYECPFPNLRLISDEELCTLAQTGRVRFLKDVSCNTEIQERRVKLVEGTELKLFNANTQSLLPSLRGGYYGYNGVMGNFHIDIYKWLYQNIHHSKAEYVQEWLSRTCEIEKHLYPTCCKYYLQLKGYPFTSYTRSKNADDLTSKAKQLIANLILEEHELRAELGLPIQQ
ncbi:MAG: dihydrodipicolinate synthase family protein [Eubacteriales bacterium]|nr:dihydrodipicolinate synthase family protein [Eubacteriales bacterium]